VAELRTKSIELEVSSPKVIVTNSIPIDYNGAISSWELEAVNGKVTLNLTADPLFIEEIKSEVTLPSIGPSQDQSAELYEESPFGYLWAMTPMEGVDKYFDAVNIGVRWNRGGASIIHWNRLQKSKEDIANGVFHWEEYDLEFDLLTRSGLNVVVNFDTFSDGPLSSTVPYALQENSWLPVNIDAYVKFIEAVVERYDGDGVDDAPGNIRIKYWQIENEPNFYPERDAESYAQLLKIAYQTVKEADPEAKVLIGGCGGPMETGMGWDLGSRTIGWYEEVLRELDGKYMDIFDWHFYGNATGDYKRLEYVIPTIRNMLNRYGFEDVPIWITEMSTYSGTLNDGGQRGGRIPDPRTFQSEEAQARNVIKRYVYPLSLGVKKIFWCVGMMEMGGETGGDGYFDHTGFICNGYGNDDRGAGVKKKAYYTYKIMTSKLEGSDWSNIESIDLGEEDVYAFKFSRNGKTVYVVWWDNYEDELALIQERVRMTEEERRREAYVTLGAIFAGLISIPVLAYIVQRKIRKRL